MNQDSNRQPLDLESVVLTIWPHHVFQVMSKLSEEQFKSGKCFTGAGSVKDDPCPLPNKSTLGQFCSDLTFVG